jgi:hypothetical protein
MVSAKSPTTNKLLPDQKCVGSWEGKKIESVKKKGGGQETERRRATH